LERALNARVFVCSGSNEIKVWRTPGRELPAKYALIKLPRAFHIVGMNSKVLDVIWHLFLPFV
jgi:hypothetical protein